MASNPRSSSSSSRRSRSTASAKEEARAPLLDLGIDETDEIPDTSQPWMNDPKAVPASRSFREGDLFADVPLDEIAFEQPSASPRRSSDVSDDMEEVDLLSGDPSFSRKARSGTSVLSSLSAGWRERWNRPTHEGASRYSASDVLLDTGRRGERSFEMRARTKEGGSASQSPNLNPSFVLVDIPIEATDTLPSFAIKYHVTTAELKRLNNLFHDQDFYSRQSLKVPIHKYGILAERFLPSSSYTYSPDQASTSTLINLDPSPPHPSTPQDEVTTQQLTLCPQSIEAKLFLQNMDRDLTRLTQQAMTRRPMSPVASDPDLQGARMRVEPLDGLGCDGADLGIPVKAMILMALILTVVLPGAFLIYKLYCSYHPESCPEGMTVPVHNFTDPH